MSDDAIHELNGRTGREAQPTAGEPVREAPPQVIELAGACVRFVERALGVTLDFTPETLPVLDHYLRAARSELESRPEARPLVTHAAGAYFGEVVRRRMPSWWRLSSDDPAFWQIQLEAVYLAFQPVAMAYDALALGVGEEGMTSSLIMDDEDREVAASRLSELPPVGEDEFVAFGTRLEVLEIAVEAAKARMMRDGLGEVVFSPDDYPDD